MVDKIRKKSLALWLWLCSAFCPRRLDRWLIRKNVSIGPVLTYAASLFDSSGLIFYSHISANQKTDEWWIRVGMGGTVKTLSSYSERRPLKASFTLKSWQLQTTRKALKASQFHLQRRAWYNPPTRKGDRLDSTGRQPGDHQKPRPAYLAQAAVRRGEFHKADL